MQQQIHITMAGGFYDRTRALIDGSIRPEGLTLSYIEMPIEEVFWPAPAYRTNRLNALTKAQPPAKRVE